MLLIVGGQKLPRTGVWHGALLRWGDWVCARFCICTTLFQFYSPFSSFCVGHFLGTRRSSDFCSAADSTPVFPIFPTFPIFPCFPHYPLYISNYTLILNLKHLQTDARFWKSLRYLGNNFPFPIPWGCRNIPRLLGQKSNRPDFLLREPN